MADIGRPHSATPRGDGDPRPDVALLLIEAHLHDEDPALAHRFELFARFGTWPVRAFTVAWLLWVPALLILGLALGNPAALVLGLTTLWVYPLSLSAALRMCRRLRCGRS